MVGDPHSSGCSLGQRLVAGQNYSNDLTKGDHFSISKHWLIIACPCQYKLHMTMVKCTHELRLRVGVDLINYSQNSVGVA